ncbi:MAG TPA: hypothetical protein VFQ44_15370 [Streptosporangiaceae bacterium]|nr:hypothetical protein [Streptosporangiaceae bacterium]
MIRFRAPVVALSLTAFTAILAAAVTPAVAAAASGQSAARAKPVTNGQAAAGWLARQMTGGSHFVDVFGGKTFVDQGRTIDAIFAFAATKVAKDFGARATSWLEQPKILSGYIGDGKTSSFAGSTAKAALAAEVQGVNPAKFGGVNLLARLAALLTKSGRYSDHSSFGDFSNAFSQSLAILALSRHGKVPVSAVNFLVSSECKDGGFPLDFAQKKCVSDPDSTGMDVQALLAAGRRLAAQRGLHWLARAQLPGGGFVSEAGAAPNANSTGLAGDAFAAGRWTRRAARASRFLLSLQVGCSGRVTRRGAIAFDKTGFAHRTAVSATAQGLLGIADVGLAVLSAHGSHPGAPRLACGS